MGNAWASMHRASKSSTYNKCPSPAKKGIPKKKKQSIHARNTGRTVRVYRRNQKRHETPCTTQWRSGVGAKASTPKFSTCNSLSLTINFATHAAQAITPTCLSSAESRVSVCNTVTREISDNDRSSADNRIVPNSDSSLNYTTIANIHILSDEHLLCNLSAVAAFQSFDVGRRLHCRDGYAVANPGVHSYGNPGRVMKFAIRTDDNILSNGQIVAVVAKKWGCDVHIASQVADNRMFGGMRRDPPCCHNGLEAASAFIFGDTHSSICSTVELIDSTSAMRALIDEFPVKGHERQACEHLLFFGLVQPWLRRVQRRWRSRWCSGRCYQDLWWWWRRWLSNVLRQLMMGCGFRG